MFCARCGKDLGVEQACNQCDWSVDEIDGSGEHFAQTRTDERQAFVSLFCGIFSWFVCGGFFVVPVVGLVLGMRVMKSDQQGIAAMGVLLNAVILILFVLSILLLGIAWMNPDPASSGVPSGRCC